jgi:hypothetical protein
LYLANVKNKPEETIAVLDHMEQVLPRRLHPMDFRLKAEMAVFYGLAGNKERQRECFRELVDELAPIADSGSNEQFSQYHPLAILLQSYQGLDEYDKALDVAQRIQRVYGATPGIPEFVNARKLELERLKGGIPEALKGGSSKDSAKK